MSELVKRTIKGKNPFTVENTEGFSEEEIISLNETFWSICKKEVLRGEESEIEEKIKRFMEEILEDFEFIEDLRLDIQKQKR